MTPRPAPTHRIPRKSRVFRPAYPAPASPPGTLRAPAAGRMALVTLRVARYTHEDLQEYVLVAPSADELAALPGDGVTWIDVQGLHDVDVLTALARIFGLHRLALEDVLAASVRPKVQRYEGCMFIVGRRPTIHQTVETDQVSLFLRHDVVISLHDVPDDIFAQVRERLRHPEGNLRRSGSDYLAYALLDAQIDQFYPVLEALGEHLEALEGQVLETPDPIVVSHIRRVKDDLLVLRRSVWPLREVVASLQADPGELIGPGVTPFLHNAYDHTVEVMEVVEIYREVAGGLTEIYLATVNNRMSEIMKVLTLMATVFIPLTFIVGVYGMNFERTAGPFNMPELGSAWGYPSVMLLMGLIAGALLLYFRRKGWL